MTVRRLSLSVSPELDRALRAVGKEMDVDLSRVAEILLREAPLLASKIQGMRGEPPRTKKGRSMEKLLAVGDASRALWDEQVRLGKVRILGPAKT